MGALESFKRNHGFMQENLRKQKQRLLPILLPWINFKTFTSMDLGDFASSVRAVWGCLVWPLDMAHVETPNSIYLPQEFLEWCLPT